MTGEAGGYYSLYSNPAGLRLPGKESDTVVVLSPFLNWKINMVSVDETFKTIQNLLNIIDNFGGLADIVAGETETLTKSAEIYSGIFKILPGDVWDEMVVGTSLPSDLSTLDSQDIIALTTMDIERFIDNIQAFSEPDKIANEMSLAIIEYSASLFSSAQLQGYAIPFDFGGTTNTKGNFPGTFGWGFRPLSFKGHLDFNTPNTTTITHTTDYFNLDISFPILLQLYAESSLRFGYALSFAEVDGLSLGIGPHISYYFGGSEKDFTVLGNLRKRNSSNSQIAMDAFTHFSTLYWGTDIGATYNLGAINHSLSFLNIGMVFRDIIGFSHPFSTKDRESRYSGDIDVGIFADKSFFYDNVTLYGGIDLLEIRGFFDRSPVSTVEKPFDHLRIKTGVSFRNRQIDTSLQLYNGIFSVALDIYIKHLFLGIQFEIGELWKTGSELRMGFRY